MATDGEHKKDPQGKPASTVGAATASNNAGVGQIEDHLQTMADALPVMLWMAEADGLCARFNKEWLEFTGRTLEQEAGYGWLENVNPDDIRMCLDTYKKAVAKQEKFSMEYRLKRADGEIRWVFGAGAPRFSPSGLLLGYIGYAVDITERKVAEERLMASLKEKEALIREVHHRVKNNLQIMYSLLNLQSRQIQDADQLQRFREAQNRIRTMALIHEKIYQAESLVLVDVREYVKSVAHSLLHSYGGAIGQVSIVSEIEDLAFGMDTATPLGLVITELVSNCLKHAFPGKRSGSVVLKLRQTGEDRYELVVQDDGVGFPENVDPAKAQTLGLELVATLVEQIRGSMEITRSPGARVKIAFSEIRRRKI